WLDTRGGCFMRVFTGCAHHVLSRLGCLTLVIAMPGWTALAAPPAYQRPPKAILDVLDAPLAPSVSVSPARDYLLLVQMASAPTIAELAEPMLRLAGLRINPVNNGPHLPPRVVGLTLRPLASGKEKTVFVRSGLRLGQPLWSPDGKRFAFTVTF